MSVCVLSQNQWDKQSVELAMKAFTVKCCQDLFSERHYKNNNKNVAVVETWSVVQ